MFQKYTNADIGILLIRLALAAVFISHGLSKWNNIDGTTAFFAMLGLGNTFVYIVASVELLSGLAMLLGVLVRIAGILLAVVMIFAIALVKIKSGFLGGYEFELTLLLASLGISYIGAGAFSLAFSLEHKGKNGKSPSLPAISNDPHPLA